MTPVNVDVGGITKGLFELIDELFTTEEERAEAKRKLLELKMAGDLAQLKVNEQEAKSENLFVSGWRPFLGWVCGLAFAYAFLIQPMIPFFWFMTTDLPLPGGLLPDLEWEMMMPVLLGMLGLGGLRTFEKARGVNKDR